MRVAYTLAMSRESAELEQELVDRRIDEAFEEVYDFLEPAATYLRATCDGEGRRALEQLERAYFRALERAARSGIGCGLPPKSDSVRQRRPVIPAMLQTEIDPAESPAGTTSASGDTVLYVTPCR